MSDRRGLMRGRDRGLTLIELLVVIAIVGILATQVVTSFASPMTTLKNDAFSLRNHYNLARAEAVRRNSEVTVEFVFDQDIDGDGDLDDGYLLYIDDDFPGLDDDPPGGPLGTYTVGSDELIRAVAFSDAVQFYDTLAKGGPPVADPDGVDFGWARDSFKLRGDGTMDNDGSVFIYIPQKNNPAEMRAAPYRLTVGNTFRLTLKRWENNDWQPKK